jgi:hypothetical protein
MRYVTITTWELMSGVDFDLTVETVRTKRLPALKELGAERVQLIRTSDRTVAAISEWPDEPTRDAAAKAIEAVRAKVRAEDQTKMTGEMMGGVVAEV